MDEPEQHAILVVDDEDDWRKSVASRLRTERRLVKSAGRNREAKEELKTWPFDLVVMNVALRREYIEKGWMFDWTGLMSDALSTGTRILVITAINEEASKVEIIRTARRYNVKRVLFKSGLDCDSLLSEVRIPSAQQSLATEPDLPPGTDCDFAQLARVLAFHVKPNHLSEAQRVLHNQYPSLTFSSLPIKARDRLQRVRQVQEQLQAMAESLRATDPTAVCSLCRAVLDLQAHKEDLRENLEMLCRCPDALSPGWLPTGVEEYHLSVIRELLTDSFGPAELRRFCLESPYFRRVISALGDDPGLDKIIDVLLQYCAERELIPTLFSKVEEVRPEQFARYRPRLTQC